MPTSSEEAERQGDERETRETMQMDRDAAIEKAGAGDPQEYELEKNRSRSVWEEPVRTDEFDFKSGFVKPGSDDEQDALDKATPAKRKK